MVKRYGEMLQQCNSHMMEMVSGKYVLASDYDALAADLREARELLTHFRFIAHGPGCVCAMCEKRAAFLEKALAPESPKGG